MCGADDACVCVQVILIDATVYALCCCVACGGGAHADACARMRLNAGCLFGMQDGISCDCFHIPV